MAGAALDLAFPGVGWWWLAAPALCGLFLLVATARTTARGTLVGLLFGWGFFVPHLSWSGIYVGAVPWLALATLQALYVAMFGALVAWTARSGLSRTVVLALAAPAWVLQEALRARTPFGGFPWGRLAFSQADAPTASWAWLAGAPGVGFAVAGSASALAVLVHVMAPGVRTRATGAAIGSGRGKVVGASLAMICVVMGAQVGSLALPVASATPQEKSVDVVAVQGNVARPGLDFNAERRAVLANHVRGTLEVAKQVTGGVRQPPDVVFWPENSSDIDPTRDGTAAQQISDAARAVGVPLVVGAVLAEPSPRISNTMLVWGSGGRSQERYVKARPVPFAEYVPYRAFFRSISRKVDLVRTDFAAGTGPPILDVGGVRWGVGICFEVAFDDQLRSAVDSGAQALFVPTNNATFGRTDESVQQLAMSRIRAKELARSVVHISTVGVSALVLPDGTVTDRGGHFTAETLTATLPLRSDLTPAARLGQGPEWVVGVLAILAPLGFRAAAARSARACRAAHRDARPTAFWTNAT